MARHARATSVNVDIRKEKEQITLSVSDDGKGFNPEEQSQAVGHGLANMRARAEELDGTFVIKSEPGQGAEIRLQLPT